MLFLCLYSCICNVWAILLYRPTVNEIGKESSRSGVLNRGEISPMGEILGIQGGNESV